MRIVELFSCFSTNLLSAINHFVRNTCPRLVERLIRSSATGMSWFSPLYIWARNLRARRSVIGWLVQQLFYVGVVVQLILLSYQWEVSNANLIIYSLFFYYFLSILQSFIYYFITSFISSFFVVFFFSHVLVKMIMVDHFSSQIFQFNSESHQVKWKMSKRCINMTRLVVRRPLITWKGNSLTSWRSNSHSDSFS